MFYMIATEQTEEDNMALVIIVLMFYILTKL